MAKLNTKHDKYNIHKILGISCLLHFILRGYYRYKYGSMCFDESITTLLCLLMHLVLSMSSLIFNIPTKRNPKSPMIWPEFRSHSIVFAGRSIAVAICLWIDLRFKTQITGFASGFIVLLTMIIADIISYFAVKQDTTMRAMSMGTYTKDWKSHLNMFYSLSQLVATMGVLTCTKIDTPFFIIFPIQLAAFLMTLVRKSICSADSWHVYYSLSLLINWLRILDVGPASTPLVGNIRIAMLIVAVFTRFKYKINKYIIWNIIIIIHIITLYID